MSLFGVMSFNRENRLVWIIRSMTVDCALSLKLPRETILGISCPCLTHANHGAFGFIVKTKFWYSCWRIFFNKSIDLKVITNKNC